MYKLNIFLIQKKYKKIKELNINNYKEVIKINNECKSVYNMKNDKFNGEYISWYDNGQLFEKSYYKNGKLNGEYQEWYENGQLELKCYYKNDELNGECIRWYENGQVLIKCYYKNGIKLKKI